MFSTILSRSPAAVILALAPALALAAAATPRVEMELATEPGFPMMGSQKWMSLLKDLDVSNVRIRAGRAGDRAEVQRRGDSPTSPYRVTGILTSRNVLELPGASFRAGDRAGIAAWLAKLRDEGVEGLTARRGAFGLTSKQLVAVHDALAVRVAATTKGRPAEEALRSIARALSVDVVVDTLTQRTLTDGGAVEDELKGMGSGAAMAALLRPLGLVLAPERPAGGKVRLRVVDVRKAPESWPVGWPPKRSPRELLPGLFKFLNVQIEDVPLTEALGALGERLGAPLLLDRNSLARRRIDIEQARVSLPAGRTYYKKILDRLLIQAKLKSELRVDEAGQAFLWISPVGA